MAMSGMESGRRERRRSGGDEDKGGEGQVERVEDGGRMRRNRRVGGLLECLGERGRGEVLSGR